MKRFSKLMSLVAVLGLVSMLFITCSKNVVEEPAVAPTSTHTYGALFLPADEYNKLPVAPTPEFKSMATVVNLNTPPVGDQGTEGSCTAWGSTYCGLSTYYQALHPAAWSQSVNIFSPEFVYDQTKATSSCTGGAYTSTVLAFVVSHGSCTWTLMPYSDTNGCSLVPTSAQTSNALLHKPTSYSTVPIAAGGAAIKAQLAAGHAVIVGGNVNSAFENLKSGGVLTTYKGTTLGGHCYCVVGYDDTKNAFKFQNSWGPTWSTAGCGYINYNNVTSWWSEAYVLN